MRDRPFYIINGITLYRLLSAPVLIMLIAFNRLDLFKWLLAISFLTDLIDGFFARRYKATSVSGAKLDSVADDLTILAGVVGILVFKKEFLKQEIIPIVILFALFLFQTALALIRYRKTTSFHTYGAKTAAILQGVFLILLFILPQPVYILFYLAVAVTGIELIEEIILIFLLPQWEANVKGLYWVLKEKRHIHSK